MELSRFQKLVAEAKRNIREISPDEAKAELDRGEAILIDVREADSFREEHASGAKHLSRGVLELEIEDEVPDVNRPIICYCGGGSRGALATESLQKMGYTNVRSIRGGLRAWKEARLPVE
jgi:rhodanese-related sulfurtransferase